MSFQKFVEGRQEPPEVLAYIYETNAEADWQVLDLPDVEADFPRRCFQDALAAAEHIGGELIHAEGCAGPWIVVEVKDYNRALEDEVHGQDSFGVRPQPPRKRIPDFTAAHAEEACRELIAEGARLNATKFVVEFEGHQLAPKQVIAKAVQLATGQPLSIREFSGGEESNRRLRRAGLTVSRL